MDCSIPGFSPGLTISPSLLKLVSIESVMPSNHLILCHPLLLLPSIFVSIRVFSNELSLWIRCLKRSSLPLILTWHHPWHRKGGKKWKGCLGPHTRLILRDLSPQWTASEEVTSSPDMLTPSTLANDDICLPLSGCQVLPPLNLGLSAQAEVLLKILY